MATGRVPTTANSPLTAKGDLFGYSTTQARVAVGNDGETLVADSSTSTGLRYQSNFAAGKNQCINGAFNVWQRGTSFGANVYTADRWQTQTDKGTTVSQQTFTAGTAPVAGYEGTFFLRQTYTATGNYAALQTKLEDVRLFAGQTVTLSYWAKADATFSNTPSISQNFGSGGSGSVGTNGTTHNITTTWTRYSSVISVPSISGKTIGTSSFLMLQPILLESTGARTIDIWGVQIEAGSVATAFQTATGTIQGELAACQRYYYLHASGDQIAISLGTYTLSNELHAHVQFPVAMRTAPTLDQVTGTNYYRCFRNGAADDFDSFIISRPNTTNTFLYQTGATISGTAGDSGIINTQNAAARLAFTSEL